jgi:putative Holliday junction resolvase
VRSLGIDFGERRIGLAISDPEGRFAVPLTTFERRSDRQAVGRIAAVVKEEGIDMLVLGDPVNVDGRRGEAAERVARFAEKLRQRTVLPVRMVGETLTSVEAERRLREAGVDPRAHPERVDAVAAQILLQEALDQGLCPRGGETP